MPFTPTEYKRTRQHILRDSDTAIELATAFNALSPQHVRYTPQRTGVARNTIGIELPAETNNNIGFDRIDR